MILNTRCIANFSVSYKTEYGQNVYVMGSLSELGNWKEYRAKLKWTEGHIWTCALSLPQQPFEYKYVVYNQRANSMVWESGRNRQCDLQSHTTITLNDVWESFRIHFLIYYPLSKGTVMRINGDPESLGSWNVYGPKNMSLTLKDVILPNGGQGKPWEFTIIVPNTTEFISYKYSTYDEKNDVAIWEREPTRILKIPGKASYTEIIQMKAEIGAAEATQVDIPLNGFIERFDVNFVSNINYDKIADYPIFIGAYPQHEEDIKILAKNGVTAVLNVQTEIDMEHRQTDPVKLREIYSKYNIKMIHYPIHDFNAEDLALKIRGAAECLSNLIAEGRTVYVHCTAGMGRAPSTVIGYLVIYKKIGLEEAYNLVKENRKVVNPNMWSLKKALIYN
jgi:protein-tyrosine phosphatase